ncbi:MAG: SH3 domain-containing protein [Cyanobacteria bacterium P01_A01_bin.135]
MNLIRSGLALALISVIGPLGPLANAARGQTPAPSTALVAQARPTPFCRRANRRLDVYSLPSVGSESVRRATIEADTEVYLVERAPGGGFIVEEGFVEAIVPSAGSTLGYVIARHLKSCAGRPDPDPDPNPEQVCARVDVPFLTVRNDASLGARAIGQLSGGRVVRILDSRNGAIQRNRVWAQIPFGSGTGWTAETNSTGTSRNLSRRFTCPN